VAAGFRLAKPPRSDAWRAAETRCLRAGEWEPRRWPSLSTWLCLMSLMDLRELTSAARPCRAGVPKAEPGDGCSDAAHRRRSIRLNSSSARR
jgi:hypothetical protein